MFLSLRYRRFSKKFSKEIYDFDHVNFRRNHDDPLKMKMISNCQSWKYDSTESTKYIEAVLYIYIYIEDNIHTMAANILRFIIPARMGLPLATVSHARYWKSIRVSDNTLAVCVTRCLNYAVVYSHPRHLDTMIVRAYPSMTRIMENFNFAFKATKISLF